MPTIGIANVSPSYDGEYELDLDIAFSTREWRWIKQLAGYTPVTINEGIDEADSSLVCALGVIAMHRADKITREQVLGAWDVLADAPFDGSAISIVTAEGEEVEEEIPPVSTSEPAASSPSRPLEKPNGSGPDSKSDSDRSDAIRVATGTTRSPTSATSAGMTSGT